VAHREDEAIPSDPSRVGWVVPQVMPEQQIRGWRQRHGSAGMPIADLLHGVHRQAARHVDDPLI
jgi:hypothetical protein